MLRSAAAALRRRGRASALLATHAPQQRGLKGWATVDPDAMSGAAPGVAQNLGARAPPPCPAPPPPPPL
jgi:hypothetical protein